MSDTTFFLVHTPDAQGYWGRHKDGIHHAIASACDAGADRHGLFVAYSGPESMTVSDFGGLQWGQGDPEPKKEGVYTASGCWLGDTLEAVANDLRQGYMHPDDYGLSAKVVQQLKSHGKK